MNSAVRAGTRRVLALISAALVLASAGGACCLQPLRCPQADEVCILPGAPAPASGALRGSQLGCVVPTNCALDARHPLRGARSRSPQ